MKMLEQKKKPQNLPDIRDYHIIDGYAENIIQRTKKEHPCRICGNTIPVGSRARERMEVASRKVRVDRKEYAHIQGQCTPRTD